MVLYTELPAQLDEELRDLAARRQLPNMVLFNTTSDAFFGDPNAHRIAQECLELLFDHRIYVNLSTKGLLPRSVYEVLTRNPSRVTVTGSVAAPTESFQRLFEPRVCGAEERIARLRELHEIGVPVRGRIEPLIPMENDSEKDFEKLVSLFRKAGVREIVTAYLQLDRPTRQRLRERLGTVQFSMIMPWYRDPNGDPMTLLDRDYRKKKYAEFKEVGRRLGVRIVVCACRNADIFTGRCFVVPAPLTPPKKELFKS